MQRFDLTQYGISGPEVLRNLSPAVLYEEAIRFDDKTYISATGALVAYSGEKTGRDSRNRIRGRDEEGRFHHHELSDAEARATTDALFCYNTRKGSNTWPAGIFEMLISRFRYRRSRKLPRFG
jgi:ATP-dependent phosphoenolpyruvate carboxykinase